MSRTAFEIAYTAIDDLYAIQKSFTNLEAVFKVMLQHFPEDSTAHAFAQLGISEVLDCSGKVVDWVDCMENELDDPHLEAEQVDCYERWERRWVLKNPDKANIS